MAEKLKTIVFKGVEDLAVEEFDVPEPGTDQILIRIEACAICTWEQRAYKGINKVEYPFIGGHEMCGHIVAMGANVDTRTWHIGDRVVCGAQFACDNCTQCKSGEENACQHFDHSKQLPGLPYHGMGGLSSYYLVSPANCFKVGDIPVTEAALAEPLSCVLHSVEAADIHFGDVALVIGCGIMGQLNALLAAKRGAMVIVSDTNEERTKLAVELGAKYAVNPAKENLVERVKEITGGDMANVVIDTTPIVSVVQDAIDCLASTGKLVFYSSFHPDVPIPFSPNLVHKRNLQFIGVANSSQRDFVRATRMIAQGTIDLKPFVNEIYPVDQAQAAFDSACKGDKFRVLVTF
jgi:2-desacetyl-2-hydroxyethyl bacteriochlorophyllide A dehydrogenase